jgi:hypothetical protein
MAKLALQMENSNVLSMGQNSFVLLMWVHGDSLVDIQKNLLSHQIACAMALLNVKRYGKVNSKLFSSLRNPN